MDPSLKAAASVACLAVGLKTLVELLPQDALLNGALGAVLLAAGALASVWK